jgi:hypothetical protein
MALSRLLNEFGLDPELISRDREMSAGLARAHESTAMELERAEEPWSLRMIAAATEYRRAGAHSVLLSDRKASSEMFREAGRVYSKLRNPYSLMMFWCSEEIDSVVARGRDFGTLDGINRTQLPYLLLTTAAEGPEADPKRVQSMGERLGAFQVSAIGILGIPAGAYIDLAQTLSGNQLSTFSIAETMIPFLVPYSTAIRRCMEDEYHWQRLAFPFHPAEPDILGVLFCIEGALRRRRQGSVLELLKLIPLFPPAADLLYNAIEGRYSIEKPSQLNEEKIFETLSRAIEMVRMAGMSGEDAKSYVVELVRRELMAQGLTVNEEHLRNLVERLMPADRGHPDVDLENRRWLRRFLEEELSRKGLDPKDHLGDFLL